MEDEEQQTDYRDFVELNEAIDSLNMKVLELEKKIDTIGVFYYTILAYFSGKLSKEEVKRVKGRFGEASSEDVSKFLRAFDIMMEKDEDARSIVDMLEELEENRWNE